jgi:hypothetical protein
MIVKKLLCCVLVSLILLTAGDLSTQLTRAMVWQTPPPPQQKPRNRLISWLRNLAGIRQLLVPIYPDGKIEPSNSITFRWGSNRSENPAHFKIRIFEKLSATDEREVWASENISGGLRSFTVTPNLNQQGGGQFSWKIEMYDANSSAFSVQAEQPFSFLTAAQLSSIKESETTVQGWIQARPDDKHLLLLMATLYARSGMNYRARDLFIEFLQANQITFGSATPSYTDLASRLSTHLEKVQTARNRAQVAYQRSRNVGEKVRLLHELLNHNLTLLEYREAAANVTALLRLTQNQTDRTALETRQQTLVQEETLAQGLFSANVDRNAIHDPRPESEININEDSTEAITQRRSLYSHARNSAFTITLDEYKSGWYVADEVVLQKYPKPRGRTIKTAYHLGEDPVALVKGLRQGNILQGVGGLGREMLRRAILSFVVNLAALKGEYMKSSARTPTLDASWATIPDERSLREDLRAFNKFARIIYPDPKDIGVSDVMRNRDELVRYLEKHWKLPAGDLNDDKFYQQKQFYDLFLYRLSPVLQLRRRGPEMPAFDSIEIVNEGFAPIDGSIVHGPPQPGIDLSFSLNGSCPGTLKKIETRPGTSKGLVIRVDSQQKGSYRVRFRLKNRARTIWESSPIGLYFI